MFYYGKIYQVCSLTNRTIMLIILDGVMGLNIKVWYYGRY